MTLEVLTILALITGPILAVQAQKWIEQLRALKERQKWVFKTLMATRATPTDPLHVQALNMIDLEFSGKSSEEEAVRVAWKVLLNCLNNCPQDFNDSGFQAQFAVWNAQVSSSSVELLYKMSIAVGYSFDKVHLEKGAYFPKGHADFQNEQSMLRKGELDVLYGRRPLYITAVPPPQQTT